MIKPSHVECTQRNVSRAMSSAGGLLRKAAQGEYELRQINNPAWLLEKPTKQGKREPEQENN